MKSNLKLKQQRLIKQANMIVAPYQRMKETGIEPHPSRRERRALARIQNKLVQLQPIVETE
jgi:hypothetical protein